ncbi:hypothetical protein FEZ51_01935 [Pediococcus stilesii]|uniref:Erf family protein n=1 Tax=Pediococcus stilesii TaxID=331679 RepID=A0A5R9BYR5_9LACO|nr:ERF family protein [Pediococcus stilesii]TLQ05443.1 hypothetical protein FEZ51_01935 [Pediococcus stilesii]
MNDFLNKLDLSDLGNVKYIASMKAQFNKELSDFHKKVKAPTKNGHVNYGKTKYDYVIFDDLTKSVDTALADSGTGMTWYQDSETVDGMVRARTHVEASNGYEKVSGWIAIKTNGNAQDIGSALTYAKRYSLGTMFGIASDTDNDGQMAKNLPTPVDRHSAIQKRMDKPAKITSNQIGTIKEHILELAKLRNQSAETITNEYLSKAKVKNLTELTSILGNQLIQRLKRDIEPLEKPATNEFDEFLKGM